MHHVLEKLDTAHQELNAVLELLVALPRTDRGEMQLTAPALRGGYPV